LNPWRETLDGSDERGVPDDALQACVPSMGRAATVARKALSGESAGVLSGDLRGKTPFFE